MISSRYGPGPSHAGLLIWLLAFAIISWLFYASARLPTKFSYLNARSSSILGSFKTPSTIRADDQIPTLVGEAQVPLTAASAAAHTIHESTADDPPPGFRYQTFDPKLATFWNNFSTLLESYAPGVEFPKQEKVPQFRNYDRINKTRFNVRQDLMDLTPEEVTTLRFAHTGFVQKAIELSSQLPYRKGSRGIVTTASGRYMPALLVTLRMLRRTGSTLPVELFVESHEVYEPAMCEEVLPKLGATCYIIEDILQAAQNKVDISGYQIKGLLPLLSSFDDMLILDSDCIPVFPPEELIEAEPYLSKGLIIWPDFWTTTVSPKFYDIASVPAPPVARWAASESGEVMISKSRHLSTILLIAYYNFYGPSHYYHLLSQGAYGEGDKETFLAAAYALRKPFYALDTFVSVMGYFKRPVHLGKMQKMLNHAHGASKSSNRANGNNEPNNGPGAAIAGMSEEEQIRQRIGLVQPPPELAQMDQKDEQKESVSKSMPASPMPEPFNRGGRRRKMKKIPGRRKTGRPGARANRKTMQSRPSNKMSAPEQMPDSNPKQVPHPKRHIDTDGAASTDVKQDTPREIEIEQMHEKSFHLQQQLMHHGRRKNMRDEARMPDRARRQDDADAPDGRPSTANSPRNGFMKTTFLQFDPRDDMNATRRNVSGLNVGLAAAENSAGINPDAVRPAFIHASPVKLNAVDLVWYWRQNVRGRLWNSERRNLELFGRDVELEMWNDVLWTACEVRSQIRHWEPSPEQQEREEQFRIQEEARKQKTDNLLTHQLAESDGPSADNDDGSQADPEPMREKPFHGDPRVQQQVQNHDSNKDEEDILDLTQVETPDSVEPDTETDSSAPSSSTTSKASKASKDSKDSKDPTERTDETDAGDIEVPKQAERQASRMRLMKRHDGASNNFSRPIQNDDHQGLPANNENRFDYDMKRARAIADENQLCRDILEIIDFLHKDD